MKGGIGNLMKQAQMMQENLRKAQDELGRIEVTGQAGGGFVSITLTCRFGVRSVHIDPSLLKEEADMIEDLVQAALADALRKVEQTSQERMAGLTAGFNIPGLSLPF